MSRTEGAGRPEDHGSPCRHTRVCPDPAGVPIRTYRKGKDFNAKGFVRTPKPKFQISELAMWISTLNKSKARTLFASTTVYSFAHKFRCCRSRHRLRVLGVEVYGFC